MSRENVEIVRRWVDAYNRRDTDGLIPLTDPSFEMKSVFAGIESGGVFRGYEGFPFAYFKSLDEAYEQFRLAPNDYIDAGAAVVMVGEADWRGRESGAEADRAEALEAVGLRE